MSNNVPANFRNWFTLNYTVHPYNTTSNVIINSNTNFEIDSISKTNRLHIKSCNLLNYGARTLKYLGPLLWNSLPDDIRNSISVYSLKSKLKKYFIDQYITPEPPSDGYYYITKPSLCLMKLTLTKYYEFRIPPFLPSRLKIRKLSEDGLQSMIYRF